VTCLLKLAMKDVLVVLRLVLSDLSAVVGYEGCAGGTEVSFE
jgi:hypothetical protein